MSRRKDKAQRFLSTFVAVLGDSGEGKAAVGGGNKKQNMSGKSFPGRGNVPWEGAECQDRALHRTSIVQPKSINYLFPFSFIFLFFSCFPLFSARSAVWELLLSNSRAECEV